MAPLVGPVLVAVAVAGCQAGGGQVPTAAGSASGLSAVVVPFEVHLSPADDGRNRQVLLGGKVVLDDAWSTQPNQRRHRMSSLTRYRAFVGKSCPRGRGFWPGLVGHDFRPACGVRPAPGD